MTWNAEVYCTQVEQDALMVSCAAPWFSSTFLCRGHSRPTPSVPTMLKTKRRQMGQGLFFPSRESRSPKGGD
jgi:hypothetical protein